MGTYIHQDQLSFQWEVFANEVLQVDTEANLTTQDKIFLANVEEVGQPDYV